MKCGEKSRINDVVVSTITDIDDRKNILHALSSLWGAKKPDEFPGPQPVSIERKHFQDLSNDTYHVGRKTDGDRYAFCAMKFNGVNLTFIVSRNFQVHLVKTEATKAAYDGTIVDCELIGDTLVMFDCVMAGGSNLKSFPFSERLKACETVNSFFRTHDPKLITDFTFEVKHFDFLTNMNQLIDATCKHKSDGYVFIPENKGIVQGTHSSMFKWKPLLQNTIDFGFQHNKIYLQNSAKLLSINISVDLNNIELNDDELTIIECAFVSDKKWKALHIRHDKTHPNGHYTYKKTLVNLTEDIQENEFLNF